LPRGDIKWGGEMIAIEIVASCESGGIILPGVLTYALLNKLSATLRKILATVPGFLTF
jgi:hypothetical protein